MFISKKEYKDLLDKIYDLNVKNTKLYDEKYHLDNMNKIAEDRIVGYKEQCKAMQMDNDSLRETISILENRNSTLDISVQDLLEENEKLIDWITKIINDLGCYKVNDRAAIEIPILNKDIAQFNDLQGNVCGRRITIPEIKFYKIG